MEKNVIRDTVVAPTVSLVGQEGYAVDMTGALTASNGQWARGVVYEGHEALHGSVITIHGRTNAKVDGSGSSIAAGDALMANSSGKFIKCDPASYDVRAHATEAVTTDTTSDIELI